MPVDLDVADRCGRLAAWGTSALQGGSTLSDAVQAITAGDGLHQVADLPGASTTQSWDEALPQLLRLNATALHYVPAVPGDVFGLPGPSTFNAAAAASGGAVLVAGVDVGLLPTVDVHGPPDDQVTSIRWTSWAVARRPGVTGPSLSEADRELTERLQESLSDLERLDTAAFRPEALGLLRSPAATASPLPPGWPERAYRLLTRSQGVLAVIALARRDDGLAVTSLEVERRTDILRELERTARRARAVAWNAGR